MIRLLVNVGTKWSTAYGNVKDSEDDILGGLYKP